VSDRDPKFTSAFWKFNQSFAGLSIFKWYQWNFEPILEELGGCGPTRLGGLCGLTGIKL
jgi:hypothetical protein